MKRFCLYITILLLGFYTSSCKKEHLTTQTSSSPVFYFTGSIGGNATRLQAGINNYYMYSSYTQNVNGVYNYTGNLKEFGCSSGCPPSIQFIINNYRTRAVGASENNISDSSLISKYYDYSIPGGSPSSFSVKFTPTVGTYASIKSYTWNFGDGSTYTGGSTLSPITHVYSHIANYSPTLSVLFNDAYSNSLTDTLQIGTISKTLSCTIIDSSGKFYANASGGTSPYIYHWNFGDTLASTDTSNLSSPTHTFSDTSHVLHVTLSIKDNLGKTAHANAYIAAPDSAAQKHLFSYSTSAPIYFPDTTYLSNVTVIYTNASGDSYSSNYPSQSDSSSFQITSVSNYQNNENGQSTKQLHIKFNCMVYNSTGDSVVIKNGDAVIAVAYK